MTTHEMKLWQEPFERILTGKKTIEYRLNDEKRALLKPGDRIRFTENGSGRTVTVVVEELITAPSFIALKEKLTARGLLQNETLEPESMRRYYSEEQEKKYGALGIRIGMLHEEC